MPAIAAAIGSAGAALRSERMLGSITLMFGAIYGAIAANMFPWPDNGWELQISSVCILAAMLLWPWPQRGRLTALLLGVAWGWIGALAMAGALLAAWLWAAAAPRFPSPALPDALRWMRRVPPWAAACALSFAAGIWLDAEGVRLAEPLWELIHGPVDAGYDPL